MLGVDVQQFVLNPLASAEVVLSETERQMGAVVCDIGGGTTDIAIYIDGDVWHTSVLAVGGNHITSDIAHGLRLPVSQAEEIKIQHGHAVKSEVASDEFFTIRPFGEEQPVQINRSELAHIIEARTEEIFSLVLQEIKRSGYDGLLPADVADPMTHQPYSRDPRYGARKAEAYLKQTGIGETSYWGPEAEFFIFNDVRYGGGVNNSFYFIDSQEGWWKSGEDLKPNFGGQIAAKRGYFPVPPTDTLQVVRSQIMLTLEGAGVPMEIVHAQGRTIKTIRIFRPPENVENTEASEA